MKPKPSLLAYSLLGIFASANLYGADGTWIQTAAGPYDWSSTATGNWSGGTVASGTDFTANFTSNLTAAQVINLAEAITIGNITFDDPTTPFFNSTISGANILTLDRTTGVPIIDVTTSGRTLNISSQISGLDGLQKNGAGALNLSNTSNNFSGGISINAGSLVVGADTHLGASTNQITFTGSSTLDLTADITSNRQINLNPGATGTIRLGAGVDYANNQKVTGSGNLIFTRTGSGARTANLSNTGNDFTGSIGIDLEGSGQAVTLSIASMTDGVGNGNIRFGTAGIGGANVINWTGASGLTLNNRRIEFFNNGDNVAAKLSNSAAGNGFTINSDLLVSGTGTKTLTLEAFAGSTNYFNGDITNGSGVAAITKAGAGTWVLSGTNTYSGTTINGFNNPASSGLVFQGIESLSNSTTLQQTHAGGVGGFGVISILDNGPNPASRSGVNINMVASNGSHIMTLYVDRISGSNTGSTIELGNLNTTQTVVGNTSQTLAVTGANGYGLKIGNVTPTLNASYTGQYSVILSPTTAPLTVSGHVQQADSGGAGSSVLLSLEGTATGNLISGDIRNSLGASPKVMAVTKTNTAGDWRLTGNNTYTGNTTISGGKLEIGGSGTLGYVSPGVGNYAGTISIASTNSGNLTVNSTASQTLGGVISGAGALVKNNDGILTLTNNNLYTGATTVSGGTLVVSGNISTSVLTSVASGAILGGAGTVGAATIDGRLAPGNSIGTLTATGDVTWNDNDSWLFELGAADADLLAASDGSDNDFLNITGGTSDFLKGTGSSFTFDFSGGGAEGWYKLVDWAGTSTFAAGDFAWSNLNSGLTASFTVDSGTSALYLNVVPIPEPGAALLGGLGVLLILRRRR